MKITPSNVPHTSSKLVLDIPVSQFTGRSQQPLHIELGFLVGSGGGHALYLSETKLIVSTSSTALPPGWSEAVDSSREWQLSREDRDRKRKDPLLAAALVSDL